MGGSTNVKEWWPAVFMVLVQIFTTGLVLLTKVVVDSGSLAWTLLTYRFFLGAILTIPLAMFFEKLALINYCYFSTVILEGCHMTGNIWQ